MPNVIEHRRHLHANAELSNRETQAVAYVAELALGYLNAGRGPGRQLAWMWDELATGVTASP